MRVPAIVAACLFASSALAAEQGGDRIETVLLVARAPSEGFAGEKLPVRIRLTQPVDGLPGKAVRVSLLDGPPGATIDALTSPIGEASTSFPVPEWKAGMYRLRISFAGDSRYAPAEAISSFEIRTAATEIRLDLTSVLGAMKSATVLRVEILRRHDGKSVPGTVQLKLDGEPFRTVAAPANVALPPRTPGIWKVEGVFDGQGPNQGSSAYKTLRTP